MAVLPIITLPNQLLKKVSEPIDINNSSYNTLLNNMLETMYAEGGVGLAAIQVGVAKRALVLDLKNDDPITRDQGFYPLFLVNPEIYEKSEEMIEGVEGCLSVPGQRIKINRHVSIKVKYFDYNGNHQVLDTDNWLARVIQHEMDHLDGKLLIDHLSKLKRDIIINKLKKANKLYN